MKTKLKPVVFVKGEYSYHRNNVHQQNLLLKALQVTTDPKKLKEMAGLKTMAEVYRTLDKLAIRKEYHEALVRNGIDLDTIIRGIKEVCDGFFTPPVVKLKGYQVLLKSLGLHEYKESESESGKTWEDVIKERSEKNEKPLELGEYKVDIPETPEREKKRQEREQAMGKSLYE